MLAIILTSIDRLQHFYWDDYHYIKNHYVWLDATIKRILEIEPDANIFGVSDHGFGPLVRRFYVNNWLSSLGLLTPSKSIVHYLMSSSGLTYHRIVDVLSRLKLYRAPAKLTPIWVKRRIPTADLEKDALIDYDRSLAYSVGIGYGVFVNRKLNDSENKELKHMISENLQSLNDHGVRPISRTYYNNEVLWGPYVHRGSDVFLLPREGYEISPHLCPFGIFGPPISTEAEPKGTHHLEGIFMAYGPDIKKGCKLNFNVQTWDITPTLFHTLGLPIPDYMDGRVLKEIFKEHAPPHIRPVKLERYRELVPRKIAEEVYTHEEEEEIRKRLESLGYL